jgi:hypothetical protein
MAGPHGETNEVRGGGFPGRGRSKRIVGRQGYNEYMLSELKQKDVWEGWVSSETRANYFADMAWRFYQRTQKVLTWVLLLCSSGAAVTVVRDWLPPRMDWVKAVLVLLTAGFSLLSLLQQNQKCSTDCSDLYFRWERLANEYKALWADMYSDDAASRLAVLEAKAADISKSGIGKVPNRRAAPSKPGKITVSVPTLKGTNCPSLRNLRNFPFTNIHNIARSYSEQN